MRNNFKKATYRPQGVLEYLITDSGFIIVAQPYMRVDTFTYRNESLRKNNKKCQWTWVNANSRAKLPGKGQIGRHNGEPSITFNTDNMKFDKETSEFTVPGLYYFDCISQHVIRIHNPKTNKTHSFTEHKYTSVDKKCRLEWTCKDVPGVKFVLNWTQK